MGIPLKTSQIPSLGRARRYPSSHCRYGMLIKTQFIWKWLIMEFIRFGTFVVYLASTIYASETGRSGENWSEPDRRFSGPLHVRVMLRRRSSLFSTTSRIPVISPRSPYLAKSAERVTLSVPSAQIRDLVRRLMLRLSLPRDSIMLDSR